MEAMLFPIFTPTTLTGVVTYRAYGPKENMDGIRHGHGTTVHMVSSTCMKHGRRR